ncbi:MAG: efflux RND transporter periplasmic adaptor subunit [Desulfobacterales bacterium]|nr:efflux RND transporter periplasmic adaptor subunit [Desulfobacterales bacterium]
MKNESIIQNKPKKRRNTGKRRNLNLIIFVLVFLGLIIAIPYYLFLPKEEKYLLKQFDYAQVSKHDFTKNVSAKGDVVAAKNVTVKSKITGLVVKVNYMPGDLVEQGDLLVEIAAEKIREDLKDAQAQYEKKVQEKKQLLLEHKRQFEQSKQQIVDAEKQYQKSVQQYPIHEKLYELGEISLAQLEEEKMNVEKARRAIEDARDTKEYTIEKHKLEIEAIEEAISNHTDAINELEKKLANRMIYADFAGKLVELKVEVGDSIQEGATVAEIIDESSLMIEGKVAQSMIDNVEVNQQVEITSGSRSYSGIITYIAAVAEKGNIEIKVAFNEVPKELRPQTSVNLDIRVGEFKDRLALPRGRYLSSGREKYVYLIEDNQAIKKEVTFGLVDGNYIEVKLGLSEADKIISSSYDNFIHLDKIQIYPEGGSIND